MYCSNVPEVLLWHTLFWVLSLAPVFILRAETWEAKALTAEEICSMVNVPNVSSHPQLRQGYPQHPCDKLTWKLNTGLSASSSEDRYRCEQRLKNSPLAENKESWNWLFMSGSFKSRFEAWLNWVYIQIFRDFTSRQALELTMPNELNDDRKRTSNYKWSWINCMILFKDL